MFCSYDGTIVVEADINRPGQTETFYLIFNVDFLIPMNNLWLKKNQLLILASLYGKPMRLGSNVKIHNITWEYL